MKQREESGRTDRDLVAVFQRNPESEAGREAVSELFRRHRDRLYQWCYRHAREHEAALDLVQETYVAAFRALPGFEGRSEFTSWLFGIMRYRCASALRKPRPRIDDEADLDALQHEGKDAEQEFIEREDEDRVLEFLKRHLDPDEQVAIWLRCYEGVAVEEITEMLKLTDRTGARALLQRARRKLRAALGSGSSEERTPR